MKFISENLVPLSIPYLVFCVGLYQFAFWETFPYNAMSCLSFQEFVTSGINVLIYGVVIVLFNYLLVYFGWGPILEKKLNLPKFKLALGYNLPLPPLVSPNVDLDRKLHLVKIGRFHIDPDKVLVGLVIITLALSVLCMVLKIWFAGIVLGGGAIALLFQHFVSETEIFLKMFKNRVQWWYVMSIAVMLPIVSVGGGLIKSVFIQTGVSYDYSYILNQRNEHVKVKVLARSKEVIILSSMDNKTILVYSAEKLSFLPIRHCRTKHK